VRFEATLLFFLCVVLCGGSILGCGGADTKLEIPAVAKGVEPKGPFIRIKVMGLGGKPLKDAVIHPSIWSKEDFKEKDVTTDENGVAVVDLPRTFRILRIWASKDDLVPRFAHWEEEELSAGTHVVPRDFTFDLRKGTTMGGFVLNEDGKPIVGARVEVMRNSDEAEENQRTSDDIWLASGGGACITDERGSWSVHNVPESEQTTVSVKLSHPDYVSDMRWGGLQEEQSVTTQSLRKQESRIVMKRGVSITGTVRDPGGKPVSDAVVAWGDDPYFDEGSQEVRTDKQGVYRFPPLPNGPRNVTVMARNWSPTIRNVEIAPEMAACDFKLQPGKTLRIRFVDEDGNPISGVYVSILGWRGVKSLYNHDHPNVLATGIPRRSGTDGVYEWTWAPDDEVKYGFALEEYENLLERDMVPVEGGHQVQLLRKQ